METVPSPCRSRPAIILNRDDFPLPDAPGLGVEFNEDAAKEYPFAFWEAPHLRRTDGSFTNW